jgi:hypothetical protein
MHDDASYFALRAQQERQAAVAATHPNVRQAHSEMADAYEHRIRLLAGDDVRPAIHLVSAA